MLRAVWLTIAKEFLLIRRDRVGLFMLLVAPIAVIAAAGFSLAKIYGGRTAPRGEYAVTVFDEDHGAIARAILDALGNQPDLAVIHSSSRRDAEQTVRERKLAVVGIVIPAGTTDAIEHGRGAQLILYTDPVKYLQTIKVELALSDLCRKITAGAAADARSQTAERTRATLPTSSIRRASPPQQARDRSRSHGHAGRRVTRGDRAEDSRAHRNCTDCRARTSQACAQHRARSHPAQDRRRHRCAAGETRRAQGLFEPSRNRARPVRELVRAN